MTRVLAIDPGPKESAWIVWDSARPVAAVAFGFDPNEDLIFRVNDPVCVCGDTIPNAMAIEMVQSFGMAVGAEVFETVYWIGRFCQAWEPKPFTRVFRKDVKMHLCGTHRAKDPNIRQALIDRFGPPGTKKEKGRTYGISGHLWSALAVAVTFCDKAEPVDSLQPAR
jgi:hypothetical protein